MNENKTNINWYPGHMAKAKRLIKEKIDLIDIVYELVDARMPYSSKIKDIDNLLKNKKRFIIMTKADLCDKKETNKWIEYYENKGYKVLLVDLEHNLGVNKIIPLTSTLIEDINKKRQEKGLKPRKIRSLIIGIPNVGKSTLINRLVGKKAVKVGNKPGITKTLDWIRINNDLELLDTPGILWPKLDNQKEALTLASLTAIKEEILPLEEVSIYILNTLYKYYKDKLKQRYDLDDVSDIVKALDTIGKKRGCLTKGGEVNYDQVYSIIINDLKNGYISGITFDRIDEV